MARFKVEITERTKKEAGAQAQGCQGGCSSDFQNCTSSPDHHGSLTKQRRNPRGEQQRRISPLTDR